MKRWRYDRILSSENILITNSHIWIGLDILLGLKTEGILQHCTASLSWDREWEYHVWVEVWVWVWVWVCRLPLPLPILSQDTVGIGVWSVTAQSPGSATSQPPVLLSSPESKSLCWLCHQELRSISLSTDSELFVSLTRVRWLLFDSHIWHTLFPVCGHSHSNRHFSGMRLHRRHSQCAVVHQKRLETTV